jgi:hypothetical protein
MPRRKRAKKQIHDSIGGGDVASLSRLIEDFLVSEIHLYITVQIEEDIYESSLNASEVINNIVAQEICITARGRL